MNRLMPTAALSLLTLAGCGHTATQPGNQTIEAPANSISTIDENAADASLGNIVDVAPDGNDSVPAEANGQ